MSKPFEASKHFDKNLAEKYEKRIRLFCPSYDALHKIIIPLLQKLPKQANFLSVGAGTGAEIVTLGKYFPSWNFVAVDISAEMLGICHKHILETDITDQVSFFHGKIQDYNGSITFDAASSIFVSHFIQSYEEKREYFHSIASYLKPDSPFIFADLFGDPMSSEFNQLMEAWLGFYASHGISDEDLNKDYAHIKNDISYLSENELEELLKEVGFAKPIRFYQTYLFGGWITTKKS